MLMQTFSRLFKSNPARRRAPVPAFMISSEALEQRAMLSGVGLDLAPADVDSDLDSKQAKKVAKQEAKLGKGAKALEPSNFNGNWELFIAETTGEADFVQNGTKVTGQITVENQGSNYIYEFTGKIKGTQLKGKGKLTDPEGVKGNLKFAVIRDSQTVTFDGTAKLKGDLTLTSDVVHGLQL